MSTGTDCHFKEVTPGRWQYELSWYPNGEPDGYDTYGPFGTYLAARVHLIDNHGEPHSISVEVHERHVHEWETVTEAYRVVGSKVEINVDELGPSASQQEVIDYIKTLPYDHPSWSVRPHWGFVQSSERQCAICGQEEKASA